MFTSIHIYIVHYRYYWNSLHYIWTDCDSLIQMIDVKWSCLDTEILLFRQLFFFKCWKLFKHLTTTLFSSFFSWSPGWLRKWSHLFLKKNKKTEWSWGVLILVLFLCFRLDTNLMGTIWSETSTFWVVKWGTWPLFRKERMTSSPMVTMVYCSLSG